MNRKVILLIILIVGVLSYLGYRGLELLSSNKYDWKETYEDNKKSVYGTYILKRFLQSTSDRGLSTIGKKLSKYLDPDNKVNGNYIIVGEAMMLDDSDAKALADYVASGNQAIISVKVFPNTLSSIIFEPCRKNPEQAVYEEFHDYYNEEYDAEEIQEEYVEDDTSSDTTYQYDDKEYPAAKEEEIIIEEGDYTEDYSSYQRELWRSADFDYLSYSYHYLDAVQLDLDSNLTNNTVVSDSIYRTYKNQNPNERQWYYLHDSIACVENNNINVLGHMNDSLVNFFELPHENGSFFIHTNPLSFTNVNMLNDQTTKYINTILSTIPQEEWHWDEYSVIDKSRGMRRNGRSNHIKNKGPLTYILQQPPLAWAWYSTVAMGLLFLVFKAKRKQRVIPVLEENENTSLAFINTIGSLYFRKNDHKQLCIDQMNLWLEDIRHKYRLNTSTLDEGFVNKVASKSGLPTEKVKSIVDYFNNIQNSNFVTENTLIGFYQMLNQFTEQSK